MNLFCRQTKKYGSFCCENVIYALWAKIWKKCVADPAVYQALPPTESEKPRQRVSNADRKVFANPESFCKKLIIGSRISGYFGKNPDSIQNIQVTCKVSGWTGKFPDDLRSVRMIWKVSRWSKKCLDNIEKLSGYSGKSLDDLEICLDNPESFWLILKFAHTLFTGIRREFENWCVLSRKFLRQKSCYPESFCFLWLWTSTEHFLPLPRHACRLI